MSGLDFSFVSSLLVHSTLILVARVCGVDRGGYCAGFGGGLAYIFDATQFHFSVPAKTDRSAFERAPPETVKDTVSMNGLFCRIVARCQLFEAWSRSELKESDNRKA